MTPTPPPAVSDPDKRTAHIEHAYNPRQGAMSNGSYHAILHQPLHVGRLHRDTGDALCKPARKFWGLATGNANARVSCTRCVELMARHDITVQT
jgi:hypothetical protein